MVTVMNLLTQEKQYYTCTPRQAVIAAYAQKPNKWGRGDYNTWDYEERYGKLVLEGNLTVSCGDFSAFIDGKEF